MAPKEEGVWPIAPDLQTKRIQPRGVSTPQELWRHTRILQSHSRTIDTTRDSRLSVTMDGRCQCGRITFTTPSPKPATIYICHCTQCRHQSSSAFGITAVFPGFRLPLSTYPKGAIGIYDRPDTRGYFCTHCGSRLVHQPLGPDGKEEGELAVKGGCLVGLTREMMGEAFHIWTKEAVVPIPEGAKAYEEGDD